MASNALKKTMPYPPVKGTLAFLKKPKALEEIASLKIIGTSPPKPFVKWAGGKRQLLDILKAAAPSNFNRYYEPFVGGGAFLFSTKPSKATISDANAELINCYKIIRDDLDALIRSLRTHKNDEDYFYTVRAKDLSKMTDVQRASRFIFLNKTCFNGLYRENSKGQFNTPFGRYTNPNIVDVSNLEAVNSYLQTANIKMLTGDYSKTLDDVKAGDFVYFDPPYDPSSQTAAFTSYVGCGFGEQEQKELANAFEMLSNQGAFVMLSNSNTQFIRGLYKKYKIQTVSATRAINCKGGKRGKEENEVLVTNY